MLEKGSGKEATLEHGLICAGEGGHRELALFMISIGAPIKVATFDFTDDDILYLIHLGVTKFGSKYRKVARKWKDWIKHAEKELETVMIQDLVSVIAAY